MTDNTLDKVLYVKTILEQHGVYYGKELLIEFDSLDEAIDFRTKLASAIADREKKMETIFFEAVKSFADKNVEYFDVGDSRVAPAVLYSFLKDGGELRLTYNKLKERQRAKEWEGNA